MNQQYPVKRQVTITDKELDSEQAKFEFIKIVGERQYRNLMKQFGEQRLTKEKLAGFTKSEISNMSQQEHEKHRDAILKDMADRVPYDKPVYGTFDVSDYQLDSYQAKDSFYKMFGFKRLMSALGLDGLEHFTDESFSKALGRDFTPYTQGDEIGKHDKKKSAPNIVESE